MIELVNESAEMQELVCWSWIDGVQVDVELACYWSAISSHKSMWSCAGEEVAASVIKSPEDCQKIAFDRPTLNRNT